MEVDAFAIGSPFNYVYAITASLSSFDFIAIKSVIYKHPKFSHNFLCCSL